MSASKISETERALFNFSGSSAALSNESSSGGAIAKISGLIGVKLAGSPEIDLLGSKLIASEISMYPSSLVRVPLTVLYSGKPWESGTVGPNLN